MTNIPIVKVNNITKAFCETCNINFSVNGCAATTNKHDITTPISDSINSTSRRACKEYPGCMQLVQERKCLCRKCNFLL